MASVWETEIEGVLLVEPQVFFDERGFFLETYREEVLGERFVQHNHSRSRRGVLRGVHFQRVRPQGKLVRAATGAIFDVAVDLRSGSKSYGRWAGVLLSDQNHRQLYVPPGFGHGFLVLSEVADVEYKCTEYYDPESDGGVRWDDPELGIQWPLAGLKPQVSEKDQGLPRLSELGKGRWPIPGAR